MPIFFTIAGVFSGALDAVAASATCIVRGSLFMALLSPNGYVPPGKKSVVLTVYNVFCCLSGSTGIFFPEILPVKKNRRTPFQNTVIDTGVGQIRRVFQLGQFQVCCDNHGPAAAVAAVDDEKHLLHSIFGTALHTQIVNDKQVVLVKAGDKVDLSSETSLSGGSEWWGSSSSAPAHPGQVERWQYIRRKKTCRFPHPQTQKQPDIVLICLFPVLHIGAGLVHQWVFGRCRWQRCSRTDSGLAGRV